MAQSRNTVAGIEMVEPKERTFCYANCHEDEEGLI